MKTFYLSYDINKKNDYSRLYSFIEANGGKEISESTYKFRTAMSLADFCDELAQVTARGDRVVVIFRMREGLAHKIVRRSVKNNTAQLPRLYIR